jgi:LAO/AO transport system kinase
MKHPLIIGIGGAHSSVGKTTLAVAILKYFKTHPPIYPFTHSPKYGAIKYTKTAFYASITDDKKIISQKGKDTKRLLDAGAEEVLWVQSPAEELEEVLPIAIDRLSHLDGIIIEGNSAIEFLKPDVVIFLFNDVKKPSSQAALKLADIIIRGQDAEYRLQIKGSMQRTVRHELYIEELINCMETILKKKNMEELLKEKSIDGKIPCSLARRIAEEIGVSYKEVGETANELKIKIKDCELGCF